MSSFTRIVVVVVAEYLFHSIPLGMERTDERPGIKSEKKRVEVDEWLSLIYGSQKEIHRKLYKFFSLVRI